MKTLQDPFELTTDLLSGMDGATSIPPAVEQCRDGKRLAAGDGVDFCIAAAMSQAERQNEPASEVLCHLKYQRDQLSILIRNLEAVPE